MHLIAQSGRDLPWRFFLSLLFGICQNEAEVQSIVHVVKLYYKCQNFCIITPYDPQRAAIQGALKAENLPADSVFAVDSFQGTVDAWPWRLLILLFHHPPGNEADYIIISAVRTSKPGFLVSLNRMNVMLSRCKKGMVIVTSQEFLKSGGAKTLLGVLASQWEKEGGIPKLWKDWRTVASGVADLPGVLGPHRLAKPAWALSIELGRSHIINFSSNELDSLFVTSSLRVCGPLDRMSINFLLKMTEMTSFLSFEFKVEGDDQTDSRMGYRGREPFAIDHNLH